MRFQWKVVLGGLVMTILLIVFTTGCSKAEIITSPYVQDIIQPEPASWYLSPLGDKLLYDTTSRRDQAIVRLLATDQEITIADCSRFSWLDNERILCYDFREQYYRPPVVISNMISNIDDFQKTSVKVVAAEQVETDKLLEQARVIYRLTPLDKPDTLLVDTSQQDDENEYYYITGIENMDKVLENYIYTIIPLYSRDAEPSKKVYSPNGEYYYFLQNDNLEIYDVAGNERLVEFRPFSDPGFYFQIGGNIPNKSGGWAADNSGVYFRVVSPSGFGPPPPIRPIQKLCVPGASGCPPT